MIRRVPFDPKLIPFTRTIFPNGVVEYDSKNRYSLMIFGMIRRRELDEPIFKPNQNYILIQLPKSMVKEEITYLGERSIKALENFFWSEIRSRFYHEVEKYVIGKMKRKDAIMAMYKKFGISEEDLPYDTVKKHVYRRFKSLEKPVNA